jgi:hypothetical protein
MHFKAGRFAAKVARRAGLPLSNKNKNKEKITI